MSAYPISNPLGQGQARQQAMSATQYERWLIQRARTRWALSIMLVAASLLVTGSSIAWGLAGGLIAGGLLLFAVGALLGMTPAVPE